MKAPNYYRVIRVQRLTGLTVLVFLLVHLVNTWLAVLGPGIYNEYQRFARTAYQHPLYELFLLFTPLLVHLGCGVWRIWKSNKVASPMSLSRRLHRYAGIFLGVVVIGHIVATRGPSLLFGIYPEFEGLAFTLQRMPGYFYPYYALFAAAALYHAGFGLHSMLKSRTARLSSLAFASRALPIAAWVATTAGLLALGGQLFPVDDASGSEFARLILGFVS